jgi:hypothetical protein
MRIQEFCFKAFPVFLACAILLGLHTFKYNTILYDDLAIKRCPSDLNYSIHGWWPEYGGHSWPSWCNKTKYKDFNLTAIKPLLSEMEKYWYACPEWKNMTDTRFWHHELEKHGSCLNYTVPDFFNHTLNAFKFAKKHNWFGCCNSMIRKVNV